MYNIETFSNKNCNIEDIYCINLKRSKDRWNQISKNNSNIKRFNAVDGNTISIDKYVNNGTCEPNVFEEDSEYSGMGALGCALSHLELWNLQKKLNKNILILEDDVILPNNLQSKYEDYKHYVPNNWDILFFGGNKILGRKISDRILQPITNQDYIKNKYNMNNFNFGLFAYMINKNSVDKILKLCKPLQFTIDKHLRENVFSKINVYYLTPTLIFHDYNQQSTIRNKYRINELYKNRIIYDVRNKINIDDYFEEINILRDNNYKKLVNKLNIKYYDKITKSDKNYHIKILNNFNISSKNSCLVLDGNMKYTGNLNDVITKIPLNYDIIFFGVNWENEPLIKNNKVIILETKMCKGLNAYAITNKCVKKIFSHINESEVVDYDKITNDILEEIINKLIYNNNINAYFTSPSIFYPIKR